MRPTWVEVDLDAVARNAAVLRELAAPAALCAVVKADGYGHGAVAVALAARRGGADWLAVALVDEAAELRSAGIDAPMLVLSEPRPHEMALAVAHDVQVTVYSAAGVRAAAAAATAHGVVWPVHLKVDTGMHRVGAHPDSLVHVAEAITSSPSLTIASLWTHCAVADDPEDPFTATQLERFQAARSMLAARGIDVPMVHLANSAGAIAHPAARLDLVRCGIALYGISPASSMRLGVTLTPALSLRSELVHVQQVAIGETVSYGRRWRAHEPTRVGTVPIGYADGVRRSYGLDGGEVLVQGRRCRVIGAVTMDQLLVDLSGVDASVGDEVVLIGRQGDEQITANEIGDLLGTIGYEVTCAISARVPRRYLGAGA
jgi:alanine racemase